MSAPKRRERRERAVALYDSPEFWHELFETIATGGGLQPFCGFKDIPYTSTWDRIAGSPELKARYEAARYRRAAWHAEQIEGLADQVTRGEIDPRAAQVAIGARQWLAGRMDPRQWGERQQVDVTHTHTHKLHMDAIRELSRRRTSLPPRGEVIEAVVVSETTPALPPAETP